MQIVGKESETCVFLHIGAVSSFQLVFSSMYNLLLPKYQIPYCEQSVTFWMEMPKSSKTPGTVFLMPIIFLVNTCVCVSQTDILYAKCVRQWFNMSTTVMWKCLCGNEIEGCGNYLPVCDLGGWCGWEFFTDFPPTHLSLRIFICSP